MTKNSQGVMAGMLLALAVVGQSPAQWNPPPFGADGGTPEPINLDIPPIEPVDPLEEEQREQALFALLNPEDFHEWLLEQDPGRAMREEIAAFAILNPGAYRRAYPKTPEEIRAEAVAAHAILNIPPVVPWSQNPN